MTLISIVLILFIIYVFTLLVFRGVISCGGFIYIIFQRLFFPKHKEDRRSLIGILLMLLAFVAVYFAFVYTPN